MSDKRALSTGAGVTSAKCSEKLRVTLKLRKLRQRAAATFTRDYQFFDVEARATRRDATRRDGMRRRRARASPFPTRKSRWSRIPPRSETRATVRKAVAVTTKREAAHRVPRGVAGSCHRLLDYCDILMVHDLTVSSKGFYLPGVPDILPSNSPSWLNKYLFWIGKDRVFMGS